MTAPDAGLRAPRRQSLRVQLLTPGDWTELDLHPSTRRASVRRAVRSAARHDPGLAGDGVRLMGLLDEISRRACEAGAFYCASLVLGEASSGVVVATAVMQVSGGSASGRAGGDYSSARVGGAFSSAELCAGLASVISADPDWSGADVGVVALPFVGPAVRICVTAVGVFVQYIVPVSHGGELLLSMSCPCAPYVATMTELFDAMAASLTIES
ncbi:MAG TPA: hypothetical protein VIL94_01450 [Acidothermaceae bacterium]|jgi:hypothetical protein